MHECMYVCTYVYMYVYVFMYVGPMYVIIMSIVIIIIDVPLC